MISSTQKTQFYSNNNSVNPRTQKGLSFEGKLTKPALVLTAFLAGSSVHAAEQATPTARAAIENQGIEIMKRLKQSDIFQSTIGESLSTNANTSIVNVAGICKEKNKNGKFNLVRFVADACSNSFNLISRVLTKEEEAVMKLGKPIESVSLAEEDLKLNLLIEGQVVNSDKFADSISKAMMDQCEISSQLPPLGKKHK